MGEVIINFIINLNRFCKIKLQSLLKLLLVKAVSDLIDLREDKKCTSFSI